MHFKFVFTRVGVHTKIVVFSGTSNGSLGNCGTVTMRDEEFDMFRSAIISAALTDLYNHWEFVPAAADG